MTLFLSKRYGGGGKRRINYNRDVWVNGKCIYKLPNYKFELSEFKLSASEQVRRLKDEVSARPMVNERSELVGLALTD